MSLIVDNVLIIGAGLIGGSLAKALKEKKLVGQVSGYGRNKENLIKGIKLGVLDHAVDDLEQAISEADLIVLGVPTLTVKEYLPLLDSHRKEAAVVTDVASVKGEIADVIKAHFGELPGWFVLGHPIAGSEQSGITASDAGLYVNHKVILTPVDSTNPDALALVESIWQSVGADVVSMPIEQHDKVLAATSHLPHALAFALVEALNQMDDKLEIFEFAAGGFRDFTRIASSHPVMWHDIMLANKDAILEVMDDYRQTLDKLEAYIRDEDGEAILAMFERAKSARDDFAELLLSRQKKNQ